MAILKKVVDGLKQFMEVLEKRGGIVLILHWFGLVRLGGSCLKPSPKRIFVLLGLSKLLIASSFS